MSDRLPVLAGSEPLELRVVVNGETRTVRSPATVLSLLGELGQDPRTVAVEYNGDILPRHRFGGVSLRAGDRLEIVHFVQGGCGGGSLVGAMCNLVSVVRVSV